MLRRSLPSHSYASSYYDSYLCLKPPLLLWAAVLYLSRSITLPIAMAFGRIAHVDSNALTAFRGFWSADGLIPSMIAALMLYALCRRVPNASRPVRWIWAHGRMILAAAAIIDIIRVLLAAMRRGEIDDQSLLSLVAAAIDLYFLVYVLAARRVRHAFSEFPPRLT
jgi:hypothetical protein